MIRQNQLTRRNRSRGFKIQYFILSLEDEGKYEIFIIYYYQQVNIKELVLFLWYQQS